LSRLDFSKVDFAVETCKVHINTTQHSQLEIESYLTKFLLIYMCATFEEMVRDLMMQKVLTANIPFVEGYFRNCIDRTVRSIKSSELSGILEKFGPKYKSHFNNNVTGTKPENSYNSLINNRHETAHKAISNLTFGELLSYYQDAKNVLQHFKDSLNVQ